MIMTTLAPLLQLTCGSGYNRTQMTVIIRYYGLLKEVNGVVAGHLQGRHPREALSWKMEQLGAGYPTRVL